MIDLDKLELLKKDTTKPGTALANAVYDAALRNAAPELFDELRAVQAFCVRFDAWILAQSEDVKMSSAMAFGDEYDRMRNGKESE